MNRKTTLIAAVGCSMIAFMVWRIGSKQDAASLSENVKEATGKPAGSTTSNTAKKSNRESSSLNERKRSGKVLRDVAALSSDPAELGMQLAAMDPDELRLLMEALAAKARIEGSGLAGKYDSLLGRALEWKCRQDMESALDWVLAMKKGRQKNDLLRVALNYVATEQSVEAGLAFYERLRFELGQQPSASYFLLEKCTMIDAATFARYCRCAIYENPDTTGWEMAFSENFDFATALNQLADIEASIPKGQGFTALPSNILSEWAKRDPQAALEWALSGKYVIMNSGINDFIDGYNEVASDADVGAVIAEVFQHSNDYTDAVEALSAVSEGSVIDEFLASAPASRSREQYLAGLLRESMNHIEYVTNNLGKNLLLRLSSEERADFFSSDVTMLPHFPFIASKLRKDLSELGHTPEQIDQMIGRMSDANKSNSTAQHRLDKILSSPHPSP